MKKFLFIIDPFSRLHLEKDTSLLLINEAIRRGYRVYSTVAHEITRFPAGLRARVWSHREPIGEDILAQKPRLEDADLNRFDLIFIRKDPPFDTSYLALCLLLQELSGPLIINRPESLLRYNEKLAILLFPDYITETMVSSRPREIEDFIERVGGRAVIKPLFECSGRGVELLDAEKSSSSPVLAAATASGRRPVMVQNFLPGVREGETRVFLLAGKIISVMKKIPLPGEFKANFDFGARGAEGKLSRRELKICAEVGRFCRKAGIFLSALDLIEDHLSEINITSPGLLVEANLINKTACERSIIEFLGNYRN